MQPHSPAMTRIYLYTRYERFWHWLQMTLIVVLLVTGLEVHASYSLLGFENAVVIHNFTGLTWLITFAFFVFWIFTTGEWRQYIPTSRRMLDMVIYYSYGIFRGAPHPFPKRKSAKHNPLQRLVYLALAACLLPIQMATGLLYWSYNQWQELGLTFISLKGIALLHVIGAFALLCFVLVHIYMTTTGHTLSAHIKAMITGWEDVTDDAEVEEWEKARKR